jgi:hypothetical protein
MFIVMVRIEGGITGFREAPMTHLQKVIHFETCEEAEALATEQHEVIKSAWHKWNSKGAVFTYWAEEVANEEEAKKKKVNCA